MKKTGWALIALLLTLIGAYIAAPFVIRSYVRNHYPGVTIEGDILIYPTGFVELRDIHLNRRNIKGVLPKVTGAFTKMVVVWGGNIDVVVDDSLKTGSKGSSSGMHLNGFHLMVVAHKEGAEVHARNLRFDSESPSVCFESGDIRAYGLHTFVTETCLDRVTKAVTVDSAVVNIELPFEVPKLGLSQEVTLSKLKVDLEAKSLEFEGAKLGTVA